MFTNANFIIQMIYFSEHKIQQKLEKNLILIFHDPILHIHHITYDVTIILKKGYRAKKQPQLLLTKFVICYVKTRTEMNYKGFFFQL